MTGVNDHFYLIVSWFYASCLLHSLPLSRCDVVDNNRLCLVVRVMSVYTFVKILSEGSNDCIKEQLSAEVGRKHPTLLIEIAN